MTIPETTNPNVSAAIQAAVEQERRFGAIEKTCDTLQLQHANFFERYAEDKVAQERRDRELLSTLKEAVAEVKKTNGTVADVVRRQGELESRLSEQRGDVEELSTGLQAQHSQSALNTSDIATLKATSASMAAAVTSTQAQVLAMVKASSDGGIRVRATWETLSTEWKILLFLVAFSGAIIALTANISTIIQHVF